MGKVTHKVSIIIPNYNGSESLKRLLPSIANQTYAEFEVIFIDDASPDRTVVEYIREFVKDHTNMCLIENSENLGFVKNCNKGFKLAEGDYVCLLTNDTEVKNTFIERNVEILDADSSIGVLSCIIVDHEGNNWFSGGYFRGGVRVLKDDFQNIREVDWVAGTSPFYRRDVFDRVGLLNEDFVMYHEDVDFCLRVRNETDYKVCIFPEKLVIHYVGSTEARLPNILKRERDILYYLGMKRSLKQAAQTSLDRMYYYGHRNHILLLRRYCPGYLPKTLFYNLAEIILLPIIAILRMRLELLLLSPHWIILLIRGTLNGLTRKQYG